MNQKGAVLLMTVLVVSAVSIAIVSTLLLIGIDNTTLGAEYGYSETAQGAADGCAELGLQAIYDDNNFTGSVNATISGTDCTYEVLNEGGDARAIQAEATTNGATRRVEISIDQLTPTINITNWENVSTF